MLMQNGWANGYHQKKSGKKLPAEPMAASSHGAIPMMIHMLCGIKDILVEDPLQSLKALTVALIWPEAYGNGHLIGTILIPAITFQWNSMVKSTK